jgi:hypothetical protein
MCGATWTRLRCRARAVEMSGAERLPGLPGSPLSSSGLQPDATSRNWRWRARPPSTRLTSLRLQHGSGFPAGRAVGRLEDVLGSSSRLTE